MAGLESGRVESVVPKPEEIIETSNAKFVLGLLGIKFSIDNTEISLRDSTMRAYKLNGGDPQQANVAIGDRKTQMVALSYDAKRILTVKYSDGGVSRFLISETQPSKNNAPQEKLSFTALQNRVNQVPDSVRENYDIALTNPSTLVINPRPLSEPDVSSKAFIQKNNAGGVNYSPGRGENFTNLSWSTESLSAFSQYKMQDTSGTPLHFNLIFGRIDVLNWKSQNDGGKIGYTEKGIISVCEATGIATYIPLSAPPAEWARFAVSAKKPVIYLYPTEKSKISVLVELSGAQMIAEYPKTQDGKWTIEATPRGNLTDTQTGKKYSYLFWEAEKKGGFTLDVKNAHCVSSGEVESYLEKSLKKLGLNTREANDFMVYWLPVLEKNQYSLIEWKTTEYTDMAKLHISPKPETLIRVFMVFRGSDTAVKTGNPKLQKAKRKGYSVIEWGGANMDEKNAVK